MGGYFGFTSVFGPAPLEAPNPHVVMLDTLGEAQGGLYTGIVLPEADPNIVGPVPEPGTLILVGTGLLGLAGFRRWRKKRV